MQAGEISSEKGNRFVPPSLTVFTLIQLVNWHFIVNKVSNLEQNLANIVLDLLVLHSSVTFLKSFTTFQQLQVLRAVGVNTKTEETSLSRFRKIVKLSFITRSQF